MPVIGRNEPCPCGSGKKYKKCCMRQVAIANTVDLMQQKIRRAEGELMESIQQWRLEVFPEDLVEHAVYHFADLVPFEPTEEIQQALWGSMMWYWVFLDWPMPLDGFDEGGAPVLAELFGSEFELPKFEQQVLQKMVDEPYSFWQVEDVVEGKGLYLKDLILGQEVYVVEQSASVKGVKGKVLLTKVITLQKTSVMIGCLPFQLPVNYVAVLLELADDLAEEEPLTPSLLFGLKEELIQIFWTYYQDSLQPPVVKNQDGDLIELNELVYQHDISMELIPEYLLPLSPFQSIEELLDNAQYDQGQLVSFSFPRIDPKKEVLLGEFKVSANRIVVATNSAKRAGRIKSSLTRRFGKKLQLIDQIWLDMEDLPQKSSMSEQDLDLEGLPPEVLQQLTQMVDNHWQGWLTEPLPALSGKTPKQAAKTKKGRQQLEVILLDFEAMNEAQANNLMKADVDWLRQQLGME